MKKEFIDYIAINYQRVLELVSGSVEIFPSKCWQN